MLVGEMRDLETIEAALTIAETGHLVLRHAAHQQRGQSINRIIDVFPPHQQPQIRAQLSFTLQAVVTQTLVPDCRRAGPQMILEIMMPNAAIRNLIREDKIHQIYSVMQTGQGASGMQTMNQSLYALLRTAPDLARRCARRSPEPDELEMMLRPPHAR